ncbi:MAG: DUF3768 domain-containing protein [Hyphomicrobiaceae bacterium]
MSDAKTDRIRDLNDQFRKALPTTTGRVLVTAGVNDQGPEFVARALAAVASFDDFTKDNDPYHEHDFGSFKLGGHKLFWKVDYYDSSGEMGSEDPSDPDVTLRVLTVMLAEEY